MIGSRLGNELNWAGTFSKEFINELSKLIEYNIVMEQNESYTHYIERVQDHLKIDISDAIERACNSITKGSVNNE